MTQRITLLMLSRMGAGDGGRETWLANFLDEVGRQGRDVQFDVIHQRSDEPTLLDATSRSERIASVRAVDRRWKWCPVSIEFLLRLAAGRRSVPRDQPILAVGSLAEALGALLLDPLHRRSRRIMWLRGIYTREKSAQIPGYARPLVALLEQWALRCFGLVVANGQDTAAFYAAKGINSEVISNAVPLHAWSMPPPEFAGALQVAFIGRLTDVKGINQFLDAAGLCETSAPGRVRFHVAGEGPARTKVEVAALHTPIQVHGQVDNLSTRTIVKDSDVCVALTLSSPDLGGGGVSNALVEQIAAGRVVVAWDNDIYRQVLDESTAYLVPQGDVQALAETFLHIDSRRGEALARAQAALAISGRYSIAAHVDRFFELLQFSVQECR